MKNRVSTNWGVKKDLCDGDWEGYCEISDNILTVPILGPGAGAGGKITPRLNMQLLLWDLKILDLHSPPPAPPNQYHWTHLQFSPTFLHFIQFYPRQVLLTSFSPPKTLSHKTSCFMGSFLSAGLRRVFMFSIYFLSSALLVREGFNVWYYVAKINFIYE